MKIFFDKRDISEMTELDMSKMIYLSPDSPNELETISHDDIYIIGGIVDDNRLFVRYFIDRYLQRLILKCLILGRLGPLNGES